MCVQDLAIVPDKRGYQENIFSYFSMKTCGYSLDVPQHLAEALLMSTKSYVFVEK